MQSYIVYMGESSFSPLSSTGESSSELDVQHMTKSHFDLLGSCLERFALSKSYWIRLNNQPLFIIVTFLRSKENVQDVMIYSYTKCINGFAANLNEAQVAAMKGKNYKFVSIYFALLFLCLFSIS